MQPSRMFNASAMHEAELMREISAMRLAEQALRSSDHPERQSALRVISIRIASWRRLAAEATRLRPRATSTAHNAGLN